MWEFIKDKLAKLGCFVLIALMAVAATAISKLVLGWFHYDEASKEAISNQVGGYVAKGLLGFVVLLGFIIMGRQVITELRGKNSTKPPNSSITPPSPLQLESERQSKNNSR